MLKIFKNYIFYLCIIYVAHVHVSCNSPEQNKLTVLSIKGKCQGTNYTIQYIDTLGRDIKPQIDSIISAIDNSINTYQTNSLISQFNKADSCIEIDNHFLDLFLLSDEVYEITDGAFDPTVKPILDIWGLGSDPINIDSIYNKTLNKGSQKQFIDSLSKITMEYIGWEMLTIDGDILRNPMYSSEEKKIDKNYICKEESNVKLTFDALGQGYTIDIISEFLQYQLGIKDFMINIGDKTMAQGKKPDLSKWSVEIDNPNYIKDKKALKKINFALNKYRAVSKNSVSEFKEYEGIKYINYVDPRTGEIAKKQVLTAVVFANDCAIANAYASSFIIMGIEEAVPLIESNPYEGVEAYFIFQNDDGELETYISSGLEDYFSK